MPRSGKRTSSKLEQFYTGAKALADDGHTIDPAFLRKKFGVTTYGASCLMYMLSEGRFFPELETVYTQDEVPNLIGKAEAKNHYIEFIEDMPPYKQGGFYEEDISETDKALYVSMGVARYLSYEEFRQFFIGLYAKTILALAGQHAYFRAALARADAVFVKNYFKGKNPNEIKPFLKRLEYTDEEIDTALALFLSV